LRGAAGHDKDLLHLEGKDYIVQDGDVVKVLRG
jgi:ribosome-binding ATPase YchF (GTP1/OBG family)